MMKMNFENNIESELLVLVPVLYLVGMALKKSKVSDKKIPILLGAIGIFLVLIWILATQDISGIRAIATVLFRAITQGILVAGASVYVNQIFVQKKKDV